MRIKCERCGRTFQPLYSERYEPTNEELKYCNRCIVIIHQEQQKKKYNPNERLEADVREATKLGFTYGQYKGGRRH